MKEWLKRFGGALDWPGNVSGKGKISDPLGDYDGDGVPNMNDCKPADPKKQDAMKFGKYLSPPTSPPKEEKMPSPMPPPQEKYRPSGPIFVPKPIPTPKPEYPLPKPNPPIRLPEWGPKPSPSFPIKPIPLPKPSPKPEYPLPKPTPIKPIPNPTFPIRPPIGTVKPIYGNPPAYIGKDGKEYPNYQYYPSSIKSIPMAQKEITKKKS